MIKRELAPDALALWHEYSKLFPMLEGRPRLDLQRDIRDNGVREPIVFLDGHVLDGRNRYTCARELGMAYPRREFGSDPTDGDDPLAFVLSKNLHRRQLTPSQLASVAAKVANMQAGDNQHTGPANLPDLSDTEPSANLPKVSNAEAAKTFNVSERSVRMAKKVQAKGVTELTEAVDRGEVSVSAAAEVARLPEDEQAELVEAGPDAIKAKAAELRNAPKADAEDETGDDAFLAALDEAEQEADADVADKTADIKTNDHGRTEAPSPEPMSDEERQARKGLSTLSLIGLKDEIVGLRIENAELRAEQGQYEAEKAKLQQKIDDLEERVALLSDDDQAGTINRLMEEIENRKQRAGYWQNMHVEERRRHNAKAAVLKKQNKEIAGLKKKLADFGGVVDA